MQQQISHAGKERGTVNEACVKGHLDRYFSKQLILGAEMQTQIFAKQCTRCCQLISTKSS